jgi:hypothetical protein
VHPERGVRITTDYRYHWVDPAEHAQYGHMAKDAVHAHWGTLTAIKEAVEAMPPAQQARFKNGIFHDNAKRFYKFPDIDPKLVAKPRDGIHPAPR